ncbi:hypothetical protein [Streptomyces sp. H39-S7]|uniref:hypothetical protein n=1 Tax=Streptomyces sp. H39-S7 TaxID=3004357 RepID=UPI0022AEC540|nr:hypothetical protein [Streptomyces sp. H39-S7]MCZ4119042.1 hypothetical protein [Streptomyces sp. H39-S7]
MARNLFGGTASDVAEDVDGRRIPGAVGTVWNGPSGGATQVLDLTDQDGAPLVQLVADNRGFIPSFYGPDGIERLWADFGNGRVGLLSVTIGERLDAHKAAGDPHGDRAYVAEQLVNYVPTRGGTVTSPAALDWLTAMVPDPVDATGNVLKLAGPDGTAYTVLKNTGALYINTKGQRAGLAIGAPGYPAGQPIINVSNGSASPTSTNAIFQVMGDGSVVTKGSLTATGPVTASNVGGARVFSGPNPPATPQAGDVWIQYG